MPGSGKSTLGIVLAKLLGYTFVDTDILIQNKEERLLQDIIDTDGINGFLNIESRVITSYDYNKAVIATGGSAVLCENTMLYLSNLSTMIYLKVDYETITTRIMNFKSRGIVMSSDQSLHDVYEIREPLYEEHADIIVDCSGKEFEEVINQIIKFLG